MRTQGRTQEAQEPPHRRSPDSLPGPQRKAKAWLPFALAGLGGLLSFLAFPPVGAWPLAFLAPAILIVGLRGARPVRGFALGLVYGLIGFGLTLSWILLFGELAWAALTLLAALSTALFGFLFRSVQRPARPVLTAFGAAALWTAIDWLRGLWPLGGFTWGSLGVSQVPNRVTVRIAVVAGVWGVTFVVVFVAALLANAASSPSKSRARLRSLGLGALAVVAPVLIPFARAEGRPLDVAAIQVDFREGQRLRSREEGDIVVTRSNIELHRMLMDRPPDLVIWGESALDPGSLAILDRVQDAVADVGVPVLLGSTSMDIRSPSVRSPLYNQAVVFDGQGRTGEVYRKTHLVPFGEYIPWKPIVGWISALERIPYELTPGERVHTLSAPGLPTFGTPICFENIFPALDRELVRRGAEFLVVLTNNASYGETAASAQHLQMSRMRAIENGRWLVHAAVSGISAFIDTGGRAYDETRLFHPGTIRRTIRASSGRTPFVRFGDWLPVASLTFVIALSLWVQLYRLGRKRGPSGPEDGRSLEG